MKKGYMWKRTCSNKSCKVKFESIRKESSTCSNKCRQAAWYDAKTDEEKAAINKLKKSQRKAKKDAKK